MGQGQGSYVYGQSVALGPEAPFLLPFAKVFGWDPLFPYLDRLYIDSDLILVLFVAIPNGCIGACRGLESISCIPIAWACECF